MCVQVYWRVARAQRLHVSHDACTIDYAYTFHQEKMINLHFEHHNSFTIVQIVNVLE